MEEPSDSAAGSLRLLKGLVYTLLAVMIVGFVGLIALLVTQFPSGGAALPFPDEIALPENAVPHAVTTSREWYAVVTNEGQILVYRRSDGALLQQIDIMIDD